MDFDTDSTITEGPYAGQDSATAMQRYYAMMSSRPAPVPEDHRVPTYGVTAPAGRHHPAYTSADRDRWTHAASYAEVGLQDPQKPMPRDSLAIQSAPLVQRQDSGYGGHAVVPRRPFLERDQRPILPPGLSTSPGAYSNLSAQPPTLPVYTPVRHRRDSLSPPPPPSAQQSRRESVSLVPVVWDLNSTVTQAPGRRDSVILAPQPRPSLHRNSLAVAQAPAPVRRAIDPLPVGISPPPVDSRRASESSPRGQNTVASKRVRINDGNLICPSPIPMHERRKGWHNRRGYVFRVCLNHPSLLMGEIANVVFFVFVFALAGINFG
jgi:hypothetical protein